MQRCLPAVRAREYKDLLVPAGIQPFDCRAAPAFKAAMAFDVTYVGTMPQTVLVLEAVKGRGIHSDHRDC